MLCCICKEREAKVHLTQIAGDKMQKVDLCEECAKQKGVNDPAGFSLADLLLGLGASQEIDQSAGGWNSNAPSAVSPRPISRKPAASAAPNATLPLPKAWKVCSRPCTKAPGTSAKFPGPAAKPRLDRAPEDLQKKLDKAVADEDFEQAAQLAR